MRMISQGPAPGMQDTHYGDQATDIMWVTSQLDHCLCRRLHQDGIELLLMKAYDRPQLLWQCKDDMIVFCIQQFLTSLLEPGCRVILMALRTAAIAAGVIRVVLIATLIALVHMATHDCCTAVQYICKGPMLTGQHLLAEPLQIPIAVTAQNIRDFEHG